MSQIPGNIQTNQSNEEEKVVYFIILWPREEKAISENKLEPFYKNPKGENSYLEEDVFKMTIKKMKKMKKKEKIEKKKIKVTTK